MARVYRLEERRGSGLFRVRLLRLVSLVPPWQPGSLVANRQRMERWCARILTRCGSVGKTREEDGWWLTRAGKKVPLTNEWKPRSSGPSLWDTTEV